ELQHATLVTDIVKTILANHNQAIVLFRRCDSVRVIKPLIWAARGNDQALRINATSILANVLDNTTVCFALHHLRDPNISASGRINLLGASAAVAGYAYKENVIAMTSVLEFLAKNSGKDVSQTMKLANELQGRIQRSANRDTPIPASLGSDCKA